MKKPLAILGGLIIFIYFFWAVIIPWSYVYSRGSVEKLETANGSSLIRVLMISGWKGGSLSTREYIHETYADGFERELGIIAYGFGRMLAAVYEKRSGGEFELRRIFINDGKIFVWKHSSEPEFQKHVWAAAEAEKSIKMGRRRLHGNRAGTPG